jgi:putative nucleotidyltransferase-like protein
VRTIGDARAGPRDLVAGLSRVVPDWASEAAAAAVLEAPRPEEVFASLYPALVRHKTLPMAIGHLTQAGADPEGMAITASLFGSTYPLSRLLPPAEGEVTLGRLLSLNGRFHDLQRAVVRDLAAACGDGRLLLTTGQAWWAAYPEHPRWSADADLATRDLDAGLEALDALVGRMGFAMHGCRLGLFRDGGSGLFKTFRMTEGFELNVSILAAGPATSLTALPLVGMETMMERARPVEWDGAKVMVASAEDLLLETALRPLREGKLQLRAVNDTRFLLERLGEGLDWDLVVRTARSDGLESALLWLTGAAEGQAGRGLIPEPVRAGLARRGRRFLYPFPAGRVGGTLVRLRSSTGHRLWKLRSLRAELGGPGAAFHLAADRSRRWALAALARAERSPGTGRRGPMERTRRAVAGTTPRRYRSLCELRDGPAPQAVGSCLSRGGARIGPPSWLSAWARQVLRRLERSMPDAGEETAFRKRGSGPSHWCEKFQTDLVPPPHWTRRAEGDLREQRESRWSSKQPEDAIGS